MMKDLVTDLEGAAADWDELVVHLHDQLRDLAAHPARTVVVVPWAQLISVAADAWARHFPDGFAPCFETTRSWAARVGFFVPGTHDLSFDAGRDWLTATHLLEAAGLGEQRDELGSVLVAQARTLGGVAATVPPAMRPDWMRVARQITAAPSDSPALLEAALARIAIAWVGGSDYATDVLFAPRVGAGLDALVAVRGLQADGLVETLLEQNVEKAITLSLRDPPQHGRVRAHACADDADEAECAAACVLAHVGAGCVPVALVAIDRGLTRRVGAILASRGLRPGVQVRDETGWRLSTTHAAADLMAMLRACLYRASSDDVLAWAKRVPAFDGSDVTALELRLRKRAARHWPTVAPSLADDALVRQIEDWRASMAAPRPLADWMRDVRGLLQASSMWPAFAADEAGAAIVDALHLDDRGLADWRQWSAAQPNMDLQRLMRWLSVALEAGSFRPPTSNRAPQVVILPMGQVPGRSFAALVLAGADEKRLSVTPNIPGPWSDRQRQLLYLPTRDDLRAEQQVAWQHAMAVPEVDVMWPQGNAQGEVLQPSPLVQLMDISAAPPQTGEDPRARRVVTVRPTERPLPSGADLPTQPVSASGYDMLRQCPYRFFAMQQLGLRKAGELDVDVQKRDWGSWVHATLYHFHVALQADPTADRERLMDAAAHRATREAGLDDQPGEFLPFAAAWPDLRRAYLDWQESWEKQGAVFQWGEDTLQVRRGDLRLKGRIDRVDRDAEGRTVLIDYKTESLDKTRKRVNSGSDDVQLPFYALLSGAEQPRAAYLNLAEREDKSPAVREFNDLAERSAALYDGMVQDFNRIANGVPLQALGEGSVCDWCEVRGLCRKDFWS